MQIGGAPLEVDMRRIESVLEIVGSGKHLAVDANTRFNLKTAVDYVETMKKYDLVWFEEASDPIDYKFQAELLKFIRVRWPQARTCSHTRMPEIWCPTPVCDLTVDRLQFDRALSYGLVEYMCTLEVIGKELFKQQLHPAWRP